MKQFTKLFGLMLMSLFLSIGLSSCSDDKDEPVDTSKYNYSIEWELVDKGEMTTAAAQSMVANLTDQMEGMIRGYNMNEAKELFTDVLENLVYNIREDIEAGDRYYRVTLRANLVRDDNGSIVASKTLYLDGDTVSLR